MKQPRLDKTFVVATIAMLCVISIAATAVAYPKIFSIMGMRTRLIEGSQQFELCREAAVSVETYRVAEKPVLDALLNEYEQRLPAGERIPELIGEVKRACKAAAVADLSIVTSEPEPLELEDDTLAECAEGRVHRVPTVVSGKLDYRRLAALLGNLAAGRRLILVRALTVEKVEGRPAVVCFQAEAEAFCFIETEREH